jgi:predicted dehydrogenase
MNVLILGDGPEERAWALAVAGLDPLHRVWAAYPGFAEFPELAGHADLDEALATAGLDAVVVGGPPALRAEGLRRSAAAGLPTICLHPPGDGIDADAYYQVALSRQETGAIVLPDLPARLHPAFRAIEEAVKANPGASIRLELVATPDAGDLVEAVFPHCVDLLRALLGEVDALSANGDPPGVRPTSRLLVPLRGPGGRTAELRIEAGHARSARLTVGLPRGSIAWEFDPRFQHPSRLIRKEQDGHETVETYDEWSPHTAMLGALAEAVAGADPSPGLIDGTRTLELASAVVRSLKRGRTIDLHYEEVSEEGSFKSVMTSMGCLILLGSLFSLPIALAGPAIGMPWLIYLAYVIPPVLVLFLMMQTLKMVVRRPAPDPEARDGER